jgi:enoyl-CoA hydratase/carnithine racemase
VTKPLVQHTRDREVAVVRICNPPMNILTATVRQELSSALQTLSNDSSVRAIVLTGDGHRAFCAGADLNEEESLTSHTVRRFLDADRLTYDEIEALRVPVVAAVNGYCIGGGLDLALACDIRIVAAAAKFCAPGAKIGLVANTARLSRLLGVAHAKDLVLTARMLDAAEAEKIGLVSQVVPDEELMEEAMRWGHLVGANAPLAVATAKQVIMRSTSAEFEAALSDELDGFAEMSQTRDHKTAVKAFFSKQSAEFIGE